MLVVSKRRMSKNTWICLFLVLCLCTTIYIFSGIQKEKKVVLTQIRTLPVASIFVKRQRRVVQMCNEIDAIKKYMDKFPATVVKHLYRYGATSDFCYCKVSKASSAFWGVTFHMLSHREVNGHLHLSSNSNSSILESHLGLSMKNTTNCVEDMEQNKTRGVFVTRNPYFRLYSSYIDKIFLGMDIAMYEAIKKGEGVMRDNPPLESLAHQMRVGCDTSDVTFEMFLRHVVRTSQTRGTILDPVIAPVTLACDPCRFNYDITIKHEYLFQETAEFLQYLNMPDIIEKLKIINDEFVLYTVHSLVKSTFHAADNNDKCDITDRTLLLSRLWEALKFKGILKYNAKFNPDDFYKVTGVEETSQKLMNIIKDRGSLTTTQRYGQSLKMTAHAYSDIREMTLKRIQGVFGLDFLLFDYHLEPPGRSKYQPDN